MRVLVTGASGFVGKHLIDFLSHQNGVEVHGFCRHELNPGFLHLCDICDANKVRELIDDIRPDRVFHLAAQSSVPVSWKEPVQTLMTNIMGELHLFEAVRVGRLSNTEAEPALT